MPAVLGTEPQKRDDLENSSQVLFEKQVAVPGNYFSQSTLNFNAQIPLLIWYIWRNANKRYGKETETNGGIILAVLHPAMRVKGVDVPLQPALQITYNGK